MLVRTPYWSTLKINMPSHIFSAMDAAAVPSSSRRHLDTLLSKLRPFQRSAYEFAVSGIPPKIDDDGDGGFTKRGRSKENLADVNNDGAEGVERLCSGGRVAGAGTGRILLGDEVRGCHAPSLSLSLSPLCCCFFWLMP